MVGYNKPECRRTNTENTSRPKRCPEWIKVSSPVGQEYQDLKTLMRNKELRAVCEEANAGAAGLEGRRAIE